MTPHASGKLWTIHHGNCLDVMRTMPAESAHAIVTDPPYGLAFMGKNWDRAVPGPEFWVEALRVAKPGAHMLAFGGTRLFHRLAVAIEDAGWEIRDCVMWVHGMGFPKSHNIGKAIDRERGAVREQIGPKRRGAQTESTGRYGAWGDGIVDTIPATDDARKWDGWGTALKPSWEPIIMARKPCIGTVADNVVATGCGAINVDACRVPMGEEYNPDLVHRQHQSNGAIKGAFGAAALIGKEIPMYKPGGRWPANLVHDGSDDVLRLMPDAGVGSAARFFYCAKANNSERYEGAADNDHPTIKSTELMRWCVRLITPPDGVVLDPFMGSGSTGKAAVAEGFRFVGIELEQRYCDIAAGRIESEHNLFNA